MGLSGLGSPEKEHRQPLYIPQVIWTARLWKHSCKASKMVINKSEAREVIGILHYSVYHTHLA